MNSKRIPRLILGAWIHHSRRNGSSGRSQQTTRHAYVSTLEKIDFYDNLKFNDWMNIARDRKLWGSRIEHFLSLPEGSYSRTNAKHKAVFLRNFD